MHRAMLKKVRMELSGKAIIFTAVDVIDDSVLF